MLVICEKSIAKRLAIGLVAFAWLLFQALTPLAASGTASTAALGVTCSTDISRPGSPAQHHETGLCCIVACSACVCGYIASSDDRDHTQLRSFVSFHWPITDASAIARPRRAHFAARGPPLFS